MKKKQFFSGLLATAALGGALLNTGVTVEAAQNYDELTDITEVNPEEGPLVDYAETDATISFEEHGPGAEDGPLRIIKAPIALDFGNHQVSKTAKTYNLETERDYSGDQRFVVVEDRRELVGPGEWDLGVQLSDMISTKDGVSTLGKAQLKWDAGQVGYDPRGVDGYGPNDWDKSEAASVDRLHNGTVWGDAASIVPLAGTNGFENKSVLIGTNLANVTGDLTQESITNYAITADHDQRVQVMKNQEANGQETREGNELNGYGEYSGMRMSNIRLTVPGQTAKTGHAYEGIVTWGLYNVLPGSD